MPNFGDKIQVKSVDDGEWYEAYFIAELAEGEVLATFFCAIFRKDGDGQDGTFYRFDNWREIPKPKRVHWEREDYPKVPRLYQKKESDHWLSITTITESGIYISGSIFVTFDKFAECFDLLNEDGSLTELYKEVSE